MRRNQTPRPPATVTTSLDLRPHERVLASARSSAGAWYVGTNLALYLPEFHEGRSRRVDWQDVERADWARDTETLAIVEVGEDDVPGQTTRVSIEEPGRLLELLRERVTKSIVCTVYAPVRGRAGLSIVGRRSPSGTGPISWSCVLSAGLDPTDPDVVHVAEQALASARYEVENL